MQAQEDTRVRPRAGWYAVPVVCWVIAIVLFTLAVIAIARVVNHGIDRLGAAPAAQTVSVPADGLTFYTTDQNSTADCTLVSTNGATTPLDSLNVTLEIQINGPTFYGLGVTPDELAPGPYTVSCNGLVPGTRLGTGPRVDVTALATRALWGLVLPAVLGVAGLIVLIVLIVKRHGCKSRIRTQQAYAASGRGSAWTSTGPPPPPPPHT